MFYNYTCICIYDRIRFLHLLPNKLFVYLNYKCKWCPHHSSVFVSKCLLSLKPNTGMTFSGYVHTNAFFSPFWPSVLTETAFLSRKTELFKNALQSGCF